MKLHFDSNQEYQLDAIKAITDIFVPPNGGMSGGDFEIHETMKGQLFNENGFGNLLTLSEEQILENLKAIQHRNEIKDLVSGLPAGKA